MLQMWAFKIIFSNSTVLISFIGEGNGTPFQYSCLENPMDGGVWWATVHGVAKNRTRLSASLSLSYIEEGNGNPLQCSCLENPRDGGAWWAAICGVAQSQTRLKCLSSSSSISFICESFTWYWIRKNDFYEKYFITILIRGLFSRNRNLLKLALSK